MASPRSALPTGALTVVGASPAEGSASVPLRATVVFEFSGALGVNTRDWNTAVIEPRAAARILSAQLCVNPEPCGGLGEPRYVRYVVEHAPDTDFTWMLFFVRGAGGQELSAPHTLRYTTAAAAGTAVVSGEVSLHASSDALTASVRARLAEVVQLARNAAFTASSGDEPLEPDVMATAQVVAESSMGPPHTRVLLLSNFTLQEPAWTVRAGAVLAPESPAFSIAHVPAGTYWPLAVRFTDPTSTEIDAVGFLDGGDGHPAAISVSDAGVAGLDLTLFAFPLRRATEGLADARARAEQLVPDPELVAITGGYGVRPSGMAYAWRYTFRSGAEDRLLDVESHALGVLAEARALTEELRAVSPIEALPVDSDRILERVMEDGGEAFLFGYRPEHVRTEVTAGDQPWLSAKHAGRPFWHVVLRTVTTSRVRTMTWDLDVLSGLPVSAAPSPPSEGPVVVRQNHPNPFSRSTRIPVSLAQEGQARVEVFDVRGRSVAVLLDGPLAPGHHEIEWAPDRLAAGLYVCRVNVEGHPPLTVSLTAQ